RPDVADVQRDEQALERLARSCRDPGEQIVDALFLPALKRKELLSMSGQTEDVGDIAEQSLLAQEDDGLFAQAFDVERTARGKVREGLENPVRAVDVHAEV